MTLAMELQRQKKAGFEEGEKHGLEKGEKIGLEKGKILTAMEMLRNGLSVEMVSKCTHLSAEYAAELKKKHQWE